MINAIIAIDQGNAIGWSDGRLPWHLPSDLKRFKELTTGKTVVMGFNTFKSLNRPNGLPNRRNVVLSRRSYSSIREHISPGIDIISSLDYIKRLEKDGDVWLCGGAQVYAEALQAGIVDALYITLVSGSSGADVVLPLDLSCWKRFILTERAANRRWDVIQCDQVPSTPSSTYLTLLRHDHLQEQGLQLDHRSGSPD